MNEKRTTDLLNQLAEDAVPAETNLWPALRATLAHKQPPVATVSSGELKGHLTMTPSINSAARLRWVGVTTFVILALAAALVLLPQGRALAQSLWLFFNPAPAESFTVDPELTAGDPAVEAGEPSNAPTAVAPSFAADVCGADLTCQLNAAAEAAGLSVQQLPADVANLTWTYVQAFPDQGTVILGYMATGGGGLVLSQSRNDLPSAVWEEVPADKAVAVTVNGAPAEYVEGTFVLYPGAEEAVWSEDGPVQRLRWEADGVLYELQKMGDPPALADMDQAALIALAERIK